MGNYKVESQIKRHVRHNLALNFQLCIFLSWNEAHRAEPEKQSGA